jgi:hypothetical protein
MLDAATGAVLRPKEGCAMQNLDDLDLTMEWKKPPAAPRVVADGSGGEAAVGQRVVLRFYLRAAVVYAFGVSPL